MATLYLSHPACLEHRVPADHPERPARLEAVEKILAHDHFAALQREEAPRAEREHLLLAHTEEHVAAIEDAVPGPQERMRPIDPDTWLSAGSWEAALRAAGAG
ncbi:MAG TPA: histone deacetylase family protein, partial [Thermopetrobacter sp.]|nr:histone deacetylase family protein [Thermopetrobacter sp.]